MAHSNSTLGLMSRRLGVFYQQPTKSDDPAQVPAGGLQDKQSLMARRLNILYNHESVNQHTLKNEILNNGDEVLDSAVDGVHNQAAILEYNGGHLQQERMIYDKRRSLDRALIYSYQGGDIRNVNWADEEKPVRALINPNKNKPDYDDKIVSVGYEHGFKPGEVFTWCGTNTKWLIYLQDLTELAYFRGDIRKCSYEISWIDGEGNTHTTYAAVRGPVETKINFIQKTGISVDEPNHSLHIMLPKTKASLEYFRRYSKFYVKGADEGAPLVCWRVEGLDWISMPGILELTAVEYYISRDQDDLEDQLAGRLVIQEREKNSSIDGDIKGVTFIKPSCNYTYTYIGEGIPLWEWDTKIPIKVVAKDDKTITIRLDKYIHGEFDLRCNDSVKKIVIESLY